MKHTKGKWGFDLGEFGLDINTGEGTIGTIYGDDIETKANANLIAAAPEMLEVLKGCLIAIRHYNDKDNISVSIEEVIAKAEGK